MGMVIWLLTPESSAFVRCSPITSNLTILFFNSRFGKLPA
jgi:hypothetical protein